MTISPSPLKPSLAGSIFISACVLLFVGMLAFVTGYRKGCETGYGAASRILYAEYSGPVDPNGSYRKAADWLEKRSRRLGRAETVEVSGSYSSPLGSPFTIELRVRRGGRNYSETVQFMGQDGSMMGIEGR